jgi:hypothetical protein
VILAELELEIQSVAAMDLERAAAVGRAFDADPDLRPRRVGGDPARVKVDGALEDLIRRSTLPIRWLTVRVNTRQEFEGGEIQLYPGRGGYIGWAPNDEEREFTLVPHKVSHGVLRSWADAEPDRLDRVASLFGRLCEATDAGYGVATLLERMRNVLPMDMGIGEVGWLNFFGPAHLERFPRLRELGAPSTNGGVIIRVADRPWEVNDTERQPIIDALGPDAFRRSWGADTARGVHVPSYEDHMRHSPGTTEMPWVRGEAERAAAKAARSRERRYTSARKRRLKALEGRADLPPVKRVAEWSTSLDADDWRSWGRRLFRRLGGELAGPIGSALVEEIASAPHNHEESVVLAGDLGPIEVRWFIDDVDTVDLYLFGSAGLIAAVNAIHDAWSEG